MVKIRLSRSGAKARPFYHVVVANSQSRRDGRNIERVGFYNPVAAGADMRLNLHLDRIDHWLGVGAQATEKVRGLIVEARRTAAAQVA